MGLKDDIEEANDSLDIGHRAHVADASDVAAKAAAAATSFLGGSGNPITTKAERSRAFTILFISLTCMGAGQTVLFNILPPLSRQLGLSEVETTGIFSVSAAIWVVTSAFWVRAQRPPRRPMSPTVRRRRSGSRAWPRLARRSVSEPSSDPELPVSS